MIGSTPISYPPIDSLPLTGDTIRRFNRTDGNRAPSGTFFYALPIHGQQGTDHDFVITINGQRIIFCIPERHEKRQEIFDRLFETGIPAMIISRNIDVFPECIEAAKKYNVPILRTNEFTSTIMNALVASLKVCLAPRITLHGVLIEIYGQGVLLLGDSGVGKSETAIELVKRGHRLIADDAVEVKRVSDKTLVGTSPDVIRYFIELRGIGIVDVRRIFGVGSVKLTEKIELVINLENWEDGKQYDRLGLDGQTTSILDIRVPSLTIPVKPGRNLAVIIEVAAMNNRYKKMGYNAAKELQERMLRSFGN